MKKIAVAVLLIGGLYVLFRGRMQTRGVSVPTAYPTSLYSPALMTT